MFQQLSFAFRKSFFIVSVSFHQQNVTYHYFSCFVDKDINTSRLGDLLQLKDLVCEIWKLKNPHPFTQHISPDAYCILDPGIQQKTNHKDCLPSQNLNSRKWSQQTNNQMIHIMSDDNKILGRCHKSFDVKFYGSQDI